MVEKKTPLYDEHIKLNAHIGHFAGFLLPIKYQSEKQEHLSVRNNVGLFDVSHMGEILVSGRQSKDFLNFVLSNNINNININQSHYTLILNHDGGIIDDLIVYCLEPNNYLLCVNASNITTDYDWLLQQSKNFDIIIENKSNAFAQMAIQGPNSFFIIKQLDQNINIKKFGFTSCLFENKKMLIARTGYTGGDGFEIFIEPSLAPILWRKLMQLENIAPCGLAARDSLRIEGGLLLYGQDITIKTSPLNAKLMPFVDISKNFIGRDALLKIKEKNKYDILCLFTMLEPSIPRHGYLILNQNHKEIGHVTSGTVTPDQKMGIGIGYIKYDEQNNNNIKILIRQKLISALIINKRNFILHN